MPVYFLSDDIEFPSPHLAREDGLLALGGDLSSERLLLAYRMGIFPWYSENDPLLWWSPDPRLVLFPQEINISRSLNKIIKKKVFNVTIDTAFHQVIKACAETERNSEGTWIFNEMIEAYSILHELGFAHSVEAWYEDELAGGLYGVSIGGCFFGESMFTRVPNASKVSLVYLVKYLESLSFDIIDCQITSKHLMNLGAREIPRKIFLDLLETSSSRNIRTGKWSF
jgi:leucyl/phenylalanyl-tRNA---protein transferase